MESMRRKYDGKQKKLPTELTVSVLPWVLWIFASMTVQNLFLPIKETERNEILINLG